MGNHQIRTLKEKNEETSHQQKGYLIKKSESLKKREGGREKNKGNLGQMEWILLRKLRIDLADVEMIGST